MARRGREIEEIAEIALTRLSQNSEVVAQQYETFLTNLQERVDEVRTGMIKDNLTA